MIDRTFNLNREPLWSVSRTTQESALSRMDKNDSSTFLFSALYCGLNLFFLLLFSGYALQIGETSHAIALFTLAAIRLFGYGAIWLARWDLLARHFATAMMFILCLYLFYNGGLQNTGPLYYFVFPSAALFLHGRLNGFIWVLALLLITSLIARGTFGFDVNRYDPVFVSRLIAICLLITILSCIPEYFRSRAELNLMLSYSELESSSYGDLSTRLANRNLLEKFLHIEFNRHIRYSSACCLMFIQADPVSHTLPGMRVSIDNMQVLNLLADVFRINLRVSDIAGRWEKNCFLLILPEISLDGARGLAQRLLDNIRSEGELLGKGEAVITASIGIADLDKRQPEEVLNNAVDNLLAAQNNKGNCFVAS